MRKISILLFVAVVVFLSGGNGANGVTVTGNPPQNGYGEINFEISGNQPFKIGDEITFDITIDDIDSGIKYVGVTFGLAKYGFDGSEPSAKFGFNGDSHDPLVDTLGPVVNGKYSVTRTYTIPDKPDIGEYNSAWAYPSYFEENPNCDPNDITCQPWSGWNKGTIYEPIEIINPVDGVCGGANTWNFKYSDTRYTASRNQCDKGSSDNTNFPEPGGRVDWQCLGTDGRDNVDCWATRKNPDPVAGICGLAARTYKNNASVFSGSLCSSGNPSPAEPTFPSAGLSVTWTCLGSYGGTDVTCTATRDDCVMTQVQCGSAARDYSCEDTNFTGPYCPEGVRKNPSSLSFPDIGKSVSWYCGVNDPETCTLRSGECIATRHKCGVIWTED